MYYTVGVVVGEEVEGRKIEKKYVGKLGRV